MVLSDKPRTKKSAINNSRLYSHNEGTACVFFWIIINYFSEPNHCIFDIS